MKGTEAIIMSEERTPEMRPKVRMVFFTGFSGKTDSIAEGL